MQWNRQNRYARAYDNDKPHGGHDLSFVINKDCTAALVGYNGAGKTTLVKLLMRLYDVKSGMIFADGKDIRRYDVKKYRDTIGTVFQDFQIFAGNVTENVMYYVFPVSVSYDKIIGMKADFEDYLMDAKLNIDTTGRNDSFSDTHLYPYEATSYPVLDRLIGSGYIDRYDHVLDYGCGKGRVLIYVNHCTGCKTTGVEVMVEFYDKAVSNVESYKKAHHEVLRDDISVVNIAAQVYVMPQSVTRIFFFNPFSIAVFKGVMGKILESYYEERRRIIMFFYYPQDEYLAYLAGIDEVMFADEIDCTDLFPEKDKRNRIMIYELCG